MQQLLGQDVGAIIFYPLDPRATKPVLQRAENQGVPVIAIDASFGKTDPVPLIATQVWQGRDIQAFLQANALAEEKPEAKVGLIGIGIPVPAIKYLTERQKFYTEEEGMTVIDTQDNPSDDVTGGEKAGNALLQRNQEIDSVLGYNDPSALGAVIAARATDRDITVVGLNGSSDGIEGVKSGKLLATVQVDPIGIGSQTADAAYSLITKQNLPLPPIVIRPGTSWTPTTSTTSRAGRRSWTSSDRPAGAVGRPTLPHRGQPMTADPFLQATALHKRYGGVHALRGARIAVFPGEVHALVGENGSGKSTMLNILSGQIKADSGTVSLAGRRVDFRDPADALRSGIATVTQETTLAPDLSITENVFLGHRMVRRGPLIDWRATRRRAFEALRRLGLDVDPSLPVRRLRPDQQQMVEIARALSIDARVLVLDEPTSSLTDDEVASLFSLVRTLRDEGVGIIFVSHRLQEVFELADRVTVLRDGQTVGEALAVELDRPQLIHLMVGRALEEIEPPRPGARRSPRPARAGCDAAAERRRRRSRCRAGRDRRPRGPRRRRPQRAARDRVRPPPPERRQHRGRRRAGVVPQPARGDSRWDRVRPCRPQGPGARARDDGA